MTSTIKTLAIAGISGALFMACGSSESTEEVVVKDYVTFSGQIENRNSDSLTLTGDNDFHRVILVNEDGSFSDTMKVQSGQFSMNDGGEYASLYLENGYDLYMTLDASKFDESLSYSGEGEGPNNYYVAAYLMEEELDFEGMKAMDSVEFQAAVEDYKTAATALLDKSGITDTTVLAKRKKSMNSTAMFLEQNYTIGKKLDAMVGLPSPTFEYENHAGGKTSLADLKGNYVYIDIWATWCGPCKFEIPFLKEIEAEFHDKNISFVSISVDDEKDHETWKNMVSEDSLTGIQLFADKSWSSQFVQDYAVFGIPRFILIDPAGNVVSGDEFRPSNPELKTLLADLLK